jgi:hypothetical protein
VLSAERRLTLVVCGAPLAARSGDVAAALADDGWEVGEVLTPAALAWRAPTTRPPAGRPDVVAAVPLTFNTANKVATGVMDNAACGVLCEALATAVPLLLVATVSERLWAHPAWSRTLHLLAGARWLDPLTGRVTAGPAPVRSGTGPELVTAFPVGSVGDALARPAPECG